MQVTNPNDVKIYNLTAGKSIPEWISDKKKRKLQHDTTMQQRIELMQDFEMPVASQCVNMTRDQNFIYVTGTYKPVIRCYDVNNLAMHFERHVDSDIIKFVILSEDYKKLCFLQCDRYFEFHAQGGRHFRLRIPKFGLDLAYHEPSCDMYFVGVTNEIYRFNCDIGRFMAPLQSAATQLNCCVVNESHHLFTCGSSQGRVECWDPRSKKRVGILDCTTAPQFLDDIEFSHTPSVTTIKYKDALQMAVGTDTGHVLLYDIRSNKPLLAKDHMYGLPIRSIHFSDSQDLVFSMDSRIVKIWHRLNGKPYTSIEPGTVLNDMCVAPNSGLMFLANEAPKVRTYYIPAIGPAPKWCSFLDNLTEELEESDLPSVYDDYKFLTRTELEDLGLTHLIGSNMLRGYMHGFFVDIRLYHKARAIANPFAFDEYRKKKVRDKIEETRKNRVESKLDNLPKVNRALAEKLMTQADFEDNTVNRKKGHEASELLTDNRFSQMFSNPDFTVDSQAPEYRLINPLINRLSRKKEEAEQFEQIQDDESGEESKKEEHNEGDSDMDQESSSSDEEDIRRTRDKIKQQHKLVRQEEYARRKEDRVREKVAQITKPKFYQVTEGDEKERKESKKSLAERLQMIASTSEQQGQHKSLRNAQMTFSLKNPNEDKLKEQARQQKEHFKERRQVARSAASILPKEKKRFTGRPR